MSVPTREIACSSKFSGVVTPAEAQAKIDEQRAVLNGKTPENFGRTGDFSCRLQTSTKN